MSQYANFFVKYNDLFVPISDFSTSSYIKKLVDGFAPWEKVRAMSEKNIDEFRRSAHEDIIRLREKKMTQEKLIKEIGQFNNSAEEKLELIENIQFDIQEYNEMIKEATCGEYFFTFLSWLIDAVKYSESFKDDPDKYIYVGIEIANPTMEDIVE